MARTMTVVGREQIFSRVSALLLFSIAATAQQVDIHGPVGSALFGKSVTVLPNGNIVVTDPASSIGNGSGAAFLYSPAGMLISTLTGGTPNDNVGSGGVVVLKSGNYVVVSPFWNGGSAIDTGAVTWGSATGGVSGVVSGSNSIIGAPTSDGISINRGVVSLANGNYLVVSPNWNEGRGAVTWGNGVTGTYGTVDASNSLVGGSASDSVGVFSAIALTNGNYIVRSPYWNSGVGAVTFGNGQTGTFGTVSETNSLVGSASGDEVGYDTAALINGNYVVASPYWNNFAGAATWGSGSGGIVGQVSVNNSIVGDAGGSMVGSAGISALSNGNYVVASPSWNGSLGAATWGNGSNGSSGVVSVSNSLVGDMTNDEVANRVVPLANGHYVVIADHWHGQAGAVGWGNGNAGTFGTISSSNSLVGVSGGDGVGRGGVAALTNGNYVVGSPTWNGGIGAATWGNGNTGVFGQVSASNSLVGSTSQDEVGSPVALKNGNYLVVSSLWGNMRGAVTWGNGSSGTVGAISPGNSLVGSVQYDEIGSNGVVMLSNGNYVIASSQWKDSLGAVTWGQGAVGTFGVVSSANSLIGSISGDAVGFYGAYGFSNGSYVVDSPQWDNGAIQNAGAITLVRGSGTTAETIDITNSVLGMVANPGNGMAIAYDAAHDQLVVGRPNENIVTLFKLDLIFGDGFE